MSFNASYTVVQNAGTPTIFTLTDTSSYASEGQGTFSDRRVYITQSNNQTLLPTGNVLGYVDFPFSMGNSISIAVLNKDYALTVELSLISTSPQPGSVYTFTQVLAFRAYGLQYLYNLVQNQLANPAIPKSSSYNSNRALLQQYMDDAANAAYYQDVVNAQVALDKAYNMINSPALYF